MSQMLNPAGSQPHGPGFHGATQTAMAPGTIAIAPMNLPGKMAAMGLTNSSPQHYGQPHPHAHSHHHLHHQQQQQQPHKVVRLQQRHQATQSTPTPILGSGGGAGYRGAERGTNPAQPLPLPPSLPTAGDLPNGAAELEVGLSAQGGDVSSSTIQIKDEKETLDMANTKEKTPMCLVNELARYNKVSHQYTLIDEQGPAHKKIFYVKLKLGEEEYSAEGESIKKAQHAAAAIALDDTKLAHPVPKPPRYVEGDANNITPTVELNALAMKRGEQTVYKIIEPRNQQQNYTPANIDFRGMYNQRYHYGRPPRPFYVMLKVGQREFIGDGPTRQLARHSAATKALRIIKNLPVPSELSKPKTTEEEDDDDSMKSEISLVHELALKRNLPVTFEVVRESGPPHMKVFVTKCLVGEITTEAEGNSKKLSKKRAAELMLQELKKLPGLPAPTAIKPKIRAPTNKKKNRNIIKVQKADPSYGVGINPISRLIQIMQAQKKKEPVYTLIAEKGLPRRREFVMQCQVDESISEGVGPNKKLAKRNAAESILQLLGFSRPSPQPTKPAIKTAGTAEGGGSSDKKVTFVDTGKGSCNGVAEQTSTTNSTGCQVVPGLLRLNQAGAASVPGMMTAPSTQHSFSGGQKDTVSLVLSRAGQKAEKQAVALADSFGIPIKFEEFSKSNSSEFLTRVTLSTTPPHIYHGTGPTLESSRDAAALSALQTLLTCSAPTPQPQLLQPSGDAVAAMIKQEPGVIPSLPRQPNSSGDQM